MADYSNLPVTTTTDSADATKVFFDQYGVQPLEFAANEVDSAIAFFKGKGFGETASRTTAVTILKQAKSENLSVFKLLDTLAGLDALTLSSLVAEILNNNRKSISVLGYRVTNVYKNDAVRNVAP
jgi:hypothetical protein